MEFMEFNGECSLWRLKENGGLWRMEFMEVNGKWSLWRFMENGVYGG